MKVIVTGANGQLGQAILQQIKQEGELHVVGLTRKELDLSDLTHISHVLDELKPDAIINCAAYTAVDLAEDEPEKANVINHLAVKTLGEWCKANAVKLIHLSTDYVFDGTETGAYLENMRSNPCNMYGQTKRDGEDALITLHAKNTWMVRTSWLFSAIGSNFYNTMVRLGKQKTEIGVVSDQLGSPTYAVDLAKALLHLLKKETPVPTLYHFANEGTCSWFDFATEIMKANALGCKVNPILTVDYPTKAKRPANSEMSTQKFCNDFQWEIPTWQDAVKRCVASQNQDTV